MLKKILIGGIVGGIIIYIWGAISWMALPWHKMIFQSFKSETAISQAINENAPQSGIYFLHSKQTQAQSDQPTPKVFAAIDKKGMPSSITPQLISNLILQIIAACFVTFLVIQINSRCYFQKLGFIFLFSLTAGMVTYIPDWSWFSFPINYTLVSIADLVIGWLLAGLFIAKIASPKKTT